MSQEYEVELEKLKKQKRDYDQKMEEIKQLQEEKKVSFVPKQCNMVWRRGDAMWRGVTQEYESKLEELEAALVNQLKTDSAVEKLEQQRKVS